MSIALPGATASQRITALRKLPYNKACFECGKSNPQWICLTNFTFVCTNCTGLLGIINFRCVSISIHSFTLNELQSLESGGNMAAERYWLGALKGSRPAIPADRDAFIKLLKVKYHQKKWVLPKEEQSERPVEISAIKNGVKADDAAFQVDFESFLQDTPQQTPQQTPHQITSLVQQQQQVRQGFSGNHNNNIPQSTAITQGSTSPGFDPFADIAMNEVPIQPLGSNNNDNNNTISTNHLLQSQQSPTTLKLKTTSLVDFSDLFDDIMPDHAKFQPSQPKQLPPSQPIISLPPQQIIPAPTAVTTPGTTSTLDWFSGAFEVLSSPLSSSSSAQQSHYQNLSKTTATTVTPIANNSTVSIVPSFNPLDLFGFSTTHTTSLPTTASMTTNTIQPNQTPLTELTQPQTTIVTVTPNDDDFDTEDWGDFSNDNNITITPVVNVPMEKSKIPQSTIPPVPQPTQQQVIQPVHISQVAQAIPSGQSNMRSNNTTPISPGIKMPSIQIQTPSNQHPTPTKVNSIVCDAQAEHASGAEDIDPFQDILPQPRALQSPKGPQQTLRQIQLPKMTLIPQSDNVPCNNGSNSLSNNIYKNNNSTDVSDKVTVFNSMIIDKTTKGTLAQPSPILSQQLQQNQQTDSEDEIDFAKPFGQFSPPRTTKAKQPSYVTHTYDFYSDPAVDNTLMNGGGISTNNDNSTNPTTNLDNVDFDADFADFDDIEFNNLPQEEPTKSLKRASLLQNEIVADKNDPFAPPTIISPQPASTLLPVATATPSPALLKLPSSRDNALSSLKNENGSPDGFPAPFPITMGAITNGRTRRQIGGGDRVSCQSPGAIQPDNSLPQQDDELFNNMSAFDSDNDDTDIIRAYDGPSRTIPNFGQNDASPSQSLNQFDADFGNDPFEDNANVNEIEDDPFSSTANAIFDDDDDDDEIEEDPFGDLVTNTNIRGDVLDKGFKEDLSTLRDTYEQSGEAEPQPTLSPDFGSSGSLEMPLHPDFKQTSGEILIQNDNDSFEAGENVVVDDEDDDDDDDDKIFSFKDDPTTLVQETISSLPIATSSPTIRIYPSTTAPPAITNVSLDKEVAEADDGGIFASSFSSAPHHAYSRESTPSVVPQQVTATALQYVPNLPTPQSNINVTVDDEFQGAEDDNYDAFAFDNDDIDLSAGQFQNSRGDLFSPPPQQQPQQQHALFSPPTNSVSFSYQQPEEVDFNNTPNDTAQSHLALDVDTTTNHIINNNDSPLLSIAPGGFGEENDFGFNQSGEEMIDDQVQTTIIHPQSTNGSNNNSTYQQQQPQQQQQLPTGEQKNENENEKNGYGGEEMNSFISEAPQAPLQLESLFQDPSLLGSPSQDQVDKLLTETSILDQNLLEEPPPKVEQDRDCQPVADKSPHPTPVIESILPLHSQNEEKEEAGEEAASSQQLSALSEEPSPQPPQTNGKSSLQQLPSSAPQQIQTLNQSQEPISTPLKATSTQFTPIDPSFGPEKSLDEDDEDDEDENGAWGFFGVPTFSLKKNSKLPPASAAQRPIESQPILPSIVQPKEPIKVPATQLKQEEARAVPRPEDARAVPPKKKNEQPQPQFAFALPQKSSVQPHVSSPVSITPIAQTVVKSIIKPFSHVVSSFVSDRHITQSVSETLPALSQQPLPPPIHSPTSTSNDPQMTLSIPGNHQTTSLPCDDFQVEPQSHNVADALDDFDFEGLNHEEIFDKASMGFLHSPSSPPPLPLSTQEKPQDQQFTQHPPDGQKRIDDVYVEQFDISVLDANEEDAAIIDIVADIKPIIMASPIDITADIEPIITHFTLAPTQSNLAQIISESHIEQPQSTNIISSSPVYIEPITLVDSHTIQDLASITLVGELDHTFLGEDLANSFEPVLLHTHPQVKVDFAIAPDSQIDGIYTTAPQFTSSNDPLEVDFECELQQHHSSPTNEPLHSSNNSSQPSPSSQQHQDDLSLAIPSPTQRPVTPEFTTDEVNDALNSPNLIKLPTVLAPSLDEDLADFPPFSSHPPTPTGNHNNNHNTNTFSLFGNIPNSHLGSSHNYGHEHGDVDGDDDEDGDSQLFDPFGLDGGFPPQLSICIAEDSSENPFMPTPTPKSGINQVEYPLGDASMSAYVFEEDSLDEKIKKDLAERERFEELRRNHSNMPQDQSPNNNNGDCQKINVEMQIEEEEEEGRFFRTSDNDDNNEFDNFETNPDDIEKMSPPLQQPFSSSAAHRGNEEDDLSNYDFYADERDKNNVPEDYFSKIQKDQEYEKQRAILKMQHLQQQQQQQYHANSPSNQFYGSYNDLLNCNIAPTNSLDDFMADGSPKYQTKMLSSDHHNNNFKNPQTFIPPSLPSTHSINNSFHNYNNEHSDIVLERFEGAAFDTTYGFDDGFDFGFGSQPPTPEAIKPLPAPTAQVAAAVNAAARATTNVAIPKQMRLDDDTSEADFDGWGN